MAAKRIAIIGAGPTGLEAAAEATERGHRVTVYERGRVAESMREWGSVRLFTPFRLNHSALGAVRLEASGDRIPDADRYLTGAEFVAEYLEPLARTFEAGTIRERTRVLRVGRDRLLKGDRVGGGREGRPFRLLVEREGQERIECADLVFDCSGTWCRPNALGNGGIPAPGERAAATVIRYGLEDILGRDRARYEGRRVLLVGAGYSAATALDQLTRLKGTQIVWARRGRSAAPFPRIVGDPLPERARISELGNQIASDRSTAVTRLTGAVIERIEPAASGTTVTLETDTGRQSCEVDSILALVGYHPDREIYAELQIHECWATMGPMKLAATLLGDDAADCLAGQARDAGSLTSPEPDFFVLGAKSYGKNVNFLIRLGLEQVRDVFTLIEANPQQDLSTARS